MDELHFIVLCHKKSAQARIEHLSSHTGLTVITAQLTIEP